MPWIVVILLLAWVLYDGDGDPLAGITDTLNRITRGSKLTRAPYDPDTGVVPGAPADLASSSGLTLDAYALARMISSEDGQADNLVKAAICWATINYAAQLGKTVEQLLVKAKLPSHDGSFGTFKNIEVGTAGYGKADRYASTALDPYDGDGQIAQGCLAGTIPDPSGGKATHYDNPGGEKDPDHIATIRAGEGLTLIPIAGIDPSYIRFWG
jgi:hypothetical protein